MHGLLYSIKSDREKYDGEDIHLKLKIFFHDPDKQWEDNIAHAFFENGYERGTPEQVKGTCQNIDSAVYNKFYKNLEKLYDSGVLYSQAANLNIGGTIDYIEEGIIVTCKSVITN